MSEPVSVHATALRIDKKGLLIRGPSGAGKSRLALALLSERGCTPASRLGKRKLGRRKIARDALVADDRVIVTPNGDKLDAAPPEALAGLIEVRGVGIVQMPWIAPVQLALVIDLFPVEDIDRMPPTAHIDLQSVTLAHCHVPIGDLAHQLLLVRTFMGLMGGKKPSSKLP